MTRQAAPLAAILLAAGNSKRMGRPKPLLEWEGRPLLERQIQLYRQAGCAVHVVLGSEAGAIAAGCPSAETAVLLLNPQPDRGMLSSIKIALASLPAATPAALFTPIDNPGVRPETLDALLQVWNDTKAPVVIPRYQGKRGHPVLLDADSIARLAAWPDDSTAREFIHSRHDVASWADVDDANVTVDIDTPEEYERLAGKGSVK